MIICTDCRRLLNTAAGECALHFVECTLFFSVLAEIFSEINFRDIWKKEKDYAKTVR